MNEDPAVVAGPIYVTYQNLWDEGIADSFAGLEDGETVDRDGLLTALTAAGYITEAKTGNASRDGYRLTITEDEFWQIAEGFIRPVED